MTVHLFLKDFLIRKTNHVGDLIVLIMKLIERAEACASLNFVVKNLQQL